MLDLYPEEYPGGIAIWGGLVSPFDTTCLTPSSGVHVHARKKPKSVSEAKEIDGNFDEVRLFVMPDLLGKQPVIISTDCALSYFVSRTLQLPMKALVCPQCKNAHLDSGIFAADLHRKHQCQFCGRDFFDSEKAIGNPIQALKEYTPDLLNESIPKEAETRGSFTLEQFSGGIQLWASNPAIIWTSPANEEAGVHLHAYDGHERVIDDTFGELRIEDYLIDPTALRIYMAQKAIGISDNVIATLSCSHCAEPHLDVGVSAAKPSVHHVCANCGFEFATPTGEARISNPIVEVFNALWMKANILGE